MYPFRVISPPNESPNPLRIAANILNPYATAFLGRCTSSAVPQSDCDYDTMGGQTMHSFAFHQCQIFVYESLNPIVR